MSMSVYVKGLMPITDDYKKKLEIYNGCNELGIEPPKELCEYFDYARRPYADGIEIELPRNLLEHSADMDYCRDYYDIDLSKLPDGVTKVRFVISY
jgi:hypothetical protein